jgi:large subunit ribosomal protein L29
MALSKISDLRDQFKSLEEIEKEIIDLKRELANLRLKKATRKSFKSHEFKFARRKIAQLNLLKTEKKFL